MEENQNQQPINPTPPVSQPTLTPPPSNVPQSGKKFKLSIKAVIGIIIFLLLAGGAAASFTVLKPQIMKLVSKPSPTVIPGLTRNPSPTPTTTTSTHTANWKTYQGSDFSFQYPFEAKESTREVNGMLVQEKENGIYFEPDYKAPYDKWYSLVMVVRNNPQNLDAKIIVENYADKIKYNCSQPACSMPAKMLSSLKPYKNGEIDGYSLTWGAETDSKIVVWTKSSKTYVFRMTGDQGYITPIGEKILDQILSTFKFTDKTPTSTSYSCPSTEWVNCMPSVGPNGYEEPAQCKKEYLTWAKQNCPNFKGAAR